jgi:hypothetical protein
MIITFSISLDDHTLAVDKNSFEKTLVHGILYSSHSQGRLGRCCILVTKKKGFLLKVLLSRWLVGRNPCARTKLRVKPGRRVMENSS